MITKQLLVESKPKTVVSSFIQAFQLKDQLSTAIFERSDEVSKSIVGYLTFVGLCNKSTSSESDLKTDYHCYSSSGFHIRNVQTLLIKKSGKDVTAIIPTSEQMHM